MFWEFWPVRSPALLFAGLAYGEAHYLELWQTLNPDPVNEEVLRNVPLREPTLWLLEPLEPGAPAPVPPSRTEDGEILSRDAHNSH